MNRGWRLRLNLTLITLAALAGCSGVPERPQAQQEVVQAEVEAEPVHPMLSEPVPVEVPSGEETLAGAEPEPEPVGDLLDRVRAGLKLGTHHHSRIDKEADWFARNPEYVERVFQRAAPYLHYIVEEVERRGLPLELALLPVIESAFQPFAYSRARAMGLWQFIPTTGTRFNLKQDWWYDGRRDIVASTQAALDYLTYLHDHFDGDWLHAIAAYNTGEGNVARAIRRNRAEKKRVDFWNLRLPAETRAYVPRLLAMAAIVAEPEKYGLSIEGIPDKPYFEEVETGGQISIEVAAELAGITTEQMYDLNPAYHRWATDPTGPHRLLVPVESAAAFRESLLQLTPDQRLRVERYTVREGDTVSSIAQQFGTSPQVLRELNQLGNANNVVVGAELRVPSKVSSLPAVVLQAAARVDSRGPDAVRAVHVVRKGDTLSGIARRYKVSVATLARINGIRTDSILRIGQRIRLHAEGGGVIASASGGGGEIIVSDDGQQVTYVVQRGDTLSAIARTLKVPVSALRSWNNLDGNLIHPGQRLVAYPGQGS
ncbi:MAG: LysM peptidoglycan-binding domain-containing protein [Pseudomonadota bacterium]|nr:MAG: lytic transglycosylase [Pseudomonadota bacterium]